jgi:hypothetical protein
VRVGDLAAFNDVVSRNEAVFRADSTLALITRLRQNVIKTGLKKIALSYSRISFVDIARKLHLGSSDDAQFLCAKVRLLHARRHVLCTPVPTRGVGALCRRFATVSSMRR